MEELLARHPGLPLVFAHMGMPDYGRFLDLTERHEHVRLSLAAGFLLPFRVACFVVCFLPAYLHCKLCVAGVPASLM